MEININCDLGEKSKLHNNENDPYLLGIINSANVFDLSLTKHNHA